MERFNGLSADITGGYWSRDEWVLTNAAERRVGERMSSFQVSLPGLYRSRVCGVSPTGLRSCTTSNGIVVDWSSPVAGRMSSRPDSTPRPPLHRPHGLFASLHPYPRKVWRRRLWLSSPRRRHCRTSGHHSYSRLAQTLPPPREKCGLEPPCCWQVYAPTLLDWDPARGAEDPAMGTRSIPYT